MVLVENKQLYERLFHRYITTASFKGLYSSLFDSAGKPLDKNIPLRVVAIKKIEFKDESFIFHDYGRSSFKVCSGD